MAWFIRFTRFLDTHLVYAQEAENSCGIACTLMTVFKINKFKPGKEALHKEKEIYDVYGEVAHTTYDGSAYTYANHLASTLNKLKVGRWKAKYYGPAGVVGAALKGLGETVPPGPHAFYKPHHGPVIVLVGWTAGGAHFVVIDTLVSAFGDVYATVCDPWDGNVHVTEVKEGTPMHYVGRHVPLSWDLGGTRHEYTGEAPGDANGWVVRRIS
jgi:hypothetical protein